MKYIKTKEDFVNEKKSYQLNEGQFSWMTHDSEEQIGSERPNTIHVWMYDNKGNSWAEKRYEGYGEFGGKDYYDLLAEMNGYTQADADKMKKELRSIGIDLAFGKLKTKDKKRKVLFPALVTSPKYNWKRHDFTQEAESDPNQSWYQEEDVYDEDGYMRSYESANETYSGNFYDFKYDIALAVDNLGISHKAIKKVSKKGKGYEVRMSSYMSNEDTWKKLGDSFGATLVSFTPGNINIGIYENSAKDVLQDATNALTKTIGSRKLDKKYIKDYLKSIEQIARKNPGKLVKDYGEFDVSDWIEDVRYNMANESLSDEVLYESTFGIKTDGNAATKGIQELQKDLTKAKIKYKFNRLSMTLSVIDVDKKEFKKAEEIINKHMKGAMSLMMAKESAVNEAKLPIEPLTCKLNEFTDHEILSFLTKSRANAMKNKLPKLVKNLQKHIKNLEKKIKLSKTIEVNEGEVDPMSTLLQSFEKAMTDKKAYAAIVDELEGAPDDMKPKIMQMADEFIPAKTDGVLELIDELENGDLDPEDIGAQETKEVLIKQFKEFIKVTEFAIKTIKKHVNESVVTEAWNFTEKQVKDVADLIAKAIEKLDNMNTKVHDMEYDKGRGAGFEIAMGGDQYEGGSYTVKPNGDVVNSAIGNKFPNAVYAKIGDRDIKKVMKNIQKFESVEVNEKVNKKDIINTIKRINKWGQDKGYKIINPFMMYTAPTHIHKKLGPVMIHPSVRAYDWRNDDEIAVSTSYENAKGWSFEKADFKDLDELPKNFKLPKQWIGESEITEASGDKAVSMAQKKVDKVMADLKANLLKFKNAKTDSDKETFKTEAGKLTKLRKEAQDNLEKAIGDAYTDVELVVMENYDTEQRKEMAAKGLALPDGSFPIKTVEDLKNAIQAYGRAKDQSAAAKFIAKRAKALGAEDLIPDTEDFQKALKEASFGRIPKFGK